MKNKLFGIVLLLCTCCNSYAQVNYFFNKLFQSDTVSTFTSVKPIEDGYLALGRIGFYGTYSGIYLTKLDISGNIEWSKPVTEPEEDYQAAFFGNCLVDTYDDNYAVASEKGATNGTVDWMLTKLTPNGDTLWQKRYYHNGKDSFAQVIATTDWGYMLAGTPQDYYPNGTFGPPYMYLVKIDYKGDTIWTHAYYDNEVVLLYAEQTQDNGYIMSGYRYSNTTGYDMIVIKVGEFGNEEWRKTFGTDQDDGGCFAYELPNGKYAVTGVIADLEYPRFNFFYALLKNNGDTVLTKTHHKPQSTQNFGPSVAYIKQDMIYVSTTAFGYTTEQVGFAILSFNGDLLYQAPINSGIGDDDYIRDIEPTPDGGFVLAGFNYQNPQSAWLVKVDAWGHTCGIANCDTTIYSGYPIGIEEVLGNSEARGWGVAPNPAQDMVTISFADLPTDTQLSIYDLNGKLATYVKVSKGTQQINLNISHLPNGMYYCHLANATGVEKLVIIGR